MSEFKLVPNSRSGNVVLRRDGFFVSYMANSITMGIVSFESDANLPETALVKDGNYYILNGDFRKEYEGMESWEECFDFYEINSKKHKSSWSN